MRATFVPSLLSMACVIGACYIDNPNQKQADAAVGDSGLSDAYANVDGASDASSGDSGPSICTKYGGYGTVEVVVQKLFGALVADCRISRFFTTLDAVKQAHLYDCLVKQVAVVLKCPGIKYDVDNAGVECRDMKTSHKGLSIRNADFDALVADLVTVMQQAGVSQADIDAVAPSILALRDDIVTNSAPDHGKQICDAGKPD